jgi:hypothetical protein
MENTQQFPSSLPSKEGERRLQVSWPNGGSLWSCLFESSAESLYTTILSDPLPPVRRFARCG